MANDTDHRQYNDKIYGIWLSLVAVDITFYLYFDFENTFSEKITFFLHQNFNTLELTISRFGKIDDTLQNWWKKKMKSKCREEIVYVKHHLHTMSLKINWWKAEIKYDNFVVVSCIAVECVRYTCITHFCVCLRRQICCRVYVFLLLCFCQQCADAMYLSNLPNITPCHSMQMSYASNTDNTCIWHWLKWKSMTWFFTFIGKIHRK